MILYGFPNLPRMEKVMAHDEGHALVLKNEAGKLNLETVALP